MAKLGNPQQRFALLSAIAIGLVLTSSASPSLAADSGPNPTCVSATPATAAMATYDMGALVSQVRDAVINARAMEARASAVAARARTATAEAETAAQRARAGQAGYVVNQFDDSLQRHYEGAFADNVRAGYGIMSFNAGRFIGDRYVGQWANNTYNGLATYYRAINENNPEGYNAGLRYEGEYVDGKRNGLGVYYWRNGGRYHGTFANALETGPSVYYFNDGRKYEGDYGNDKPNGLGVEWDPQGHMCRQGIWTDGELTTPLTP